MNIALPESRLVAYFGYGSLVNRATLRTPFLHAVPARLNGWRRLWCPRPDMPGLPAALLSVERCEGAACDGLIVFDREENLSAVDKREARYRRVELDHYDVRPAEPLPPHCPLYVYEADRSHPVHPQAPVILGSYLDAVMQGFHVEHGWEGLRRFFAETANFVIPVHDDRAEPIYPRAVTLTPETRVLYAKLLTEHAQNPLN